MEIFKSKREKAFLVISYLVTTSLFFILLIALLFSVQTIKSFIFAITLLSIFSLPIIYIIKRNINTKFLIINLIFLSFVLSQWFQLNQAKDWNFELVCLNNCKKYNYNLLNSITEKELLNLWYQVAWLIWITPTQLRDFKKIELEYEKNVDINLPTQIPNALINKKEEKYFLYKPEKAKTDKLILVVHWNAWWFLFYQKFLKSFADKYNLKVAEPIFGWWNWNEKWWVDLIYNTYYDLLNAWEITTKTEVILIGLSNWWVGLSRAIYFDDKNIFKKVIYISRVIESAVVQSKEFLQNAKNKDFTIIQWKLDDRVFYNEYLDNKASFPNAKTLIFEKWDHFLMLNEQDKVIKEITRVIEK